MDNIQKLLKDMCNQATELRDKGLNADYLDSFVDRLWDLHPEVKVLK